MVPVNRNPFATGTIGDQGRWMCVDDVGLPRAIRNHNYRLILYLLTCERPTLSVVHCLPPP